MKKPKPKERFGSFIKALGPEKMAMVDSLLLHGEVAEGIAKTIKQEWKLVPHLKLSSLIELLRQYRRINLIGKFKMLIDPNAPALSKFADKVDVLENLTRLVQLQQDRVTKGINAEIVMHPGLLDRKLRYEVTALGNLYAQLAELQMDLGILRKVPQKMQIEGMASRTQQLLSEAMNSSTNVDAALAQAFEVLDGQFRVIPSDDNAKRKH